MEELDQMKRAALVTGASSGIGLLTAVALARGGFKVFAAMRDTARADRLLQAAEEAGGVSGLEVVQLDVTDHGAFEAAVAQVIETCGRIDVLVNNAGYASGGFVEDVPMEEWRSQLETNLFGVVAGTKAVLPHMREQRSGCIVNISSVSGRIAMPGYAPYSTSKFALEGFSESLRLEMKPFGVHVVLVEPGAYRTEIWRKGFESLIAPETSPYRRLLEQVLRASRQSAAAAPDPQEVAELICSIVGKRNPRLRYLSGRGARAGIWAKAALPWTWFEALVLRVLYRSRD